MNIFSNQYLHLMQKVERRQIDVYTNNIYHLTLRMYDCGRILIISLWSPLNQNFVNARMTIFVS